MVFLAREHVARLGSGTTVAGIRQETIRGLPIALPPLHEQRRIAEILSSVDEAIAATRAVIEQTKKVKQGVLERLLTKGIGHTRFKQTEIGEIRRSGRWQRWAMPLSPSSMVTEARNTLKPKTTKMMAIASS